MVKFIFYSFTWWKNGPLQNLFFYVSLPMWGSKKERNKKSMCPKKKKKERKKWKEEGIEFILEFPKIWEHFYSFSFYNLKDLSKFLLWFHELWIFILVSFRRLLFDCHFLFIALILVFLFRKSKTSSVIYARIIVHLL